MPGKKQTLVNQVVGGLLWLLSAVSGIYTVYSLHKLAGTVYALFGENFYTGVLIGQVAAVLFGFVWILVFFATGEYLFKHSGERIFWRLFAWIIGTELLVICLAILFG